MRDPVEETTTLRDQLTEAGFDWENGTIVFHYRDKKSDFDEYDIVSSGDSWGYDKVMVYPTDDCSVLLDRKFDYGYGGAECPVFVAKDSDNIYFTGKYDGATWIELVEIDIMKYLDVENYEIPYVGGG